MLSVNFRQATELINRLKAVIETPFRSLHDALHPDGPPSAVIANMLAAPTSLLYTAMVFLLPSREFLLLLTNWLFPFVL